MGKTITEKIIEKAAGIEIKIGEFVRVPMGNLVLGRGSVQLPVEQLNKLGIHKVWDPKKVKVIIGGHDYVTPRGLRQRRMTIQGAKKYGIPTENIVDIPEGGEEHTGSIDHGWVLPGSVYLSGHNGQTAIEGSMGAVALPLSNGAGEIITAIITGKSWLHVPPSMKINLTGDLQAGVSSRDVFEWVLGKIGPSGALGTNIAMMVEWTGSAVEEMSIDSRLALLSNTAYLGAYSGIINPDKKTIDYVKARTKEPFEPLTSDPDAEYEKTLNFDVSSIEPQVAMHPKRHLIKPITEVHGMKINRGFIGSCANGRLEDLRVAAKILKGRKIKPDVLLTITPSTAAVLKKAIKEGLIEIFMDAGALLTTPSCGMCPGHTTPLVEDEVCVASSTVNNPGRMKGLKAQIYLASPATVAASCVEGKLTDPRSYFKGG